MVRRLFVGVGQREHPAIGPETAEKRHAERISAAEESGRHRHLRQAGHRALLTRARLLAVALQPAFVRVRPRQVRRIQQRVEPLLLHRIDEQRAERVARRVERRRRRAQLVARRRRLKRVAQPPRADGRQLARREQALDREHRLARPPRRASGTTSIRPSANRARCRAPARSARRDPESSRRRWSRRPPGAPARRSPSWPRLRARR